MALNENIRWKQRFNNFSKAYKLLDSVFKEMKVDELSLLEQEGVIQRYRKA